MFQTNKSTYYFCAFGWIRQFHQHKSILFDAFFGALRAEDVGPIGDESFADQRSAATGALEAVVMPMTILERDKSCAADSGDGLGAGRAPFCEELSKAFSAVWFLVLGSESLAGKRLVTVGTSKALTMPRVVLVSHTSSSDNLGTFHASSGKLFFVTAGAINVLFPRDERLGANRRLANETGKALFVPLATLVLHFLGSGPEDFSASVATSSVHGVVARPAKDLLSLGAELLVDQRHPALVAKEACLVPVTILVRQVL